MTDHGLHIAQATSLVINHMHAPITLGRRGRSGGDDQLPTAYMLDVRELLRVSAETGLTIIPWRDGEPHAFVLLGTRPVREWVAAPDRHRPAAMATGVGAAAGSRLAGLDRRTG